MFWLRALFFAAPLAVIFGAVLLFRQVSRLELPDKVEAMTCVIRQPVGSLNPLFPLDGTTREVKDLIFEPLLLRDDDLNLKPNIINSWQLKTVVTVRCESEEAAGDSEAKIDSGEYLDGDMTVLEVERMGSALRVVFEGHDSTLPQRFVEGFDSDNLGNYLLVRVSLKNSIQNSFETFLRRSVEKTQIQMLEYEGDQVANLFVKGDIDLLLRELQLYYESNLILEPLIEEMGTQSHTSFREAYIDLREDVKWHDGHSLSAADLLFSYEALTGPNSPLQLGSSFWFVEAIEKVSEFQLRLICQDSPAMMMESWEKLPVLPVHLLGGLVDTQEWMPYFENPVGNGPYRIVTRREDGGIELVANEEFFRAVPEQKSIVYRRVDSLESKLLALRSGKIDTIEPDQRFQGWVDRNPGEVRQMRCLPRFQHFVAWNMEEVPFGKSEMRTALARSADLESILQDSATEFQSVTQSLFFPGMPYSSKPMPLPLYNPKSAEQLMEKCGYQFDSKREIRLDPEGNPFIFTLSVNEASAGQVRLATALAEQWSAVGVTVQVELLPWAELLSERLATRDFDAVLLSWEVPLERDRYATWFSEGGGSGGGNLWGLRNQVVDELLRKLRYTEDPEDLKSVAAELEAEIAALQPCLFVCDTGRKIWYREGAIEVVRPNSDGGMSISSMGIGKAGIERVRPWWVRQSGVEMIPEIEIK